MFSTIKISTKSAIIFAYLIVFFSFPYLGFGQSNTQKGWGALLQNNDTEALKHFKTGIINKENESNMGIIYCNLLRDNKETNIDYLKSFLSSADTPEAYLYGLWASQSLEMYSIADYFSDKVDFLKSIINNPNTSSQFLPHARYTMGKYAEYHYMYKEGKSHYQQNMPILDWQITGYFDNVQQSGFDKDYGPISDPAPTATFKNKNGADIKWISPPHVKPDGWIDYTYISDQSYNCQFYAQTFVNSPTDREVMLCTGVSGTLKVWINDALAISIDKERNTTFDIYNCKIKLNKGYNRILVQTGSSKNSSNNFQVRLTDDNFKSVADLSVTSLPQLYTKSNAPLPSLIPLKWESYFENKIKANDDDILSNIMLMDTYLHNDKDQMAYEIAQVLHKKHPKSTLVNIYLQRILEQLDKDEEASRIKNIIKDQDVESILSLEGKFYDEINSKNYSKAKEILTSIESKSGLTPKVYSYKMMIAAYNSEKDNLKKLTNAAFKQYPQIYYFTKIKGSLQREEGDAYGYVTTLKNYLKKYNNDDAMVDLAQCYTDMGNQAQGIDLYEEKYENEPYGVGYLTKISTHYFNANQYSKATELVKTKLETFPYSSDAWYDLGLIYEQQKLEKDAINAFKKVLYYEPNNYTVRRKLRQIAKKKDVFDYFPTVEAYKIARNPKKIDDFDGASFAILDYEVQKVVYEEGGDEEKTYIIIKILNEEGIESFKEYAVSSSDNYQSASNEKAQIIKANGDKVDADVNGNDIVFSGLQVGDCIYMINRYTNYRRGKLQPHFWGNFQLEYFVPAEQIRFQILVPQGKQFSHQVENGSTKPTIKEMDEFSLYTWEKQNVKKIESEPLMPASTDILEMVHFSSLPDWKFVTEWYKDLAYQSDGNDPMIKEALNKALNGKTNLSKVQTIKAIYEYIVTNIGYSSISFRQGPYIPQKPSRTLDAKLGDCKDVSTLFVAMAEQAGIEANLVLVSTRDQGIKDMVLPSTNFNHCIAQVNVEDKNYFLELTSKNLPFGTTPFSLQGAQVLPIPIKNKPVDPYAKIVKINQSHIPNMVARKTEIKLNGAEILVEKKEIRTGIFANETRYNFEDLNKEDTEKQIKEAITSIYGGTVTLSNYTFKNIDNLSDTVFKTLNYKVGSAVSKVGTLSIMPFFWGDGEPNLNFLTETERKTTLDYFQRYGANQDIEEIVIRAGAKGEQFIELPSDISYSFDDKIIYKYTYKKSGNDIIAKREVIVKSWEVTPDRYADFKEFFAKIVEEDKKQIGFK